MEADADSQDAVFEAEMAALGRRYLEGLPARRAALAAAWADCVDGGDEAPWQRLRDVAHKLAGSAPSYGYAAIGQVARELDRALSGRTPCRVQVGVHVAVEQLTAGLNKVLDSH